MDSRTGKKLANTYVEEESGAGGGMLAGGFAKAVGPPALGVDDGVGAHVSGRLEVGEGVAGVEVGGLVPGVPETVIASFCPAWQWLPKCSPAESRVMFADPVVMVLPMALSSLHAS
ncbi:unnamed protein product [Fraxinus pennsylvanica]|uniref:Uncharacterized protein n=1 Tax=Fraxinus pennsylvanica TaxID=56036 RepID=A0AAD2EF00_9LAMI|nr:unnamed protein product [Fraxinus pennsylvanica]